MTIPLSTRLHVPGAIRPSASRCALTARRPAVMVRRSALFSLLLATGLAHALGLPPIYETAPKELVESKTVYKGAIGAFFENLAFGTRGDLFVTNYLTGEILRIDRDGRVSPWAQVAGKIAGIAFDDDGSALVSGWRDGTVPAVFSVSPQGQVALLTLLDGGMFPNGVARLSHGVFLVADSYKGAIWQVNVQRKMAEVWLEHEMLSRANAEDPTPAVNGLKVFRGSVYVSNTARQTLLRIPLTGQKAGTPLKVAEKLSIDDFAFDSKGRLFGATHVYNSVVRVDRDGRVTVVAGLDQGMAGSTAVAFAPERSDRGGLYVVTNGGVSFPPPGGVQTGKVVRLSFNTKP